jgi:transposase-like protein
VGTIQHPATSGVGYPRSWSEFFERPPDEGACLSYLEQLRWPKGFVCARCGVVGEASRLSRGKLMCRTCRYQCTVTAGTIFEKTRTPLRSWFGAAWYVTNQKLGVSALGLQRVLGLGSYQTAWAMLHRLRRAMVRPAREKLRGLVEVDETYVPMSDRNPTKQAKRKSNTDDTLVAVAIEIHETKGYGRIRLQRIPSASKRYLLPFIHDNVEPGSEVHTDGSSVYLSLSKLGYRHRRDPTTNSETPAHVTMPGVHRIASLLERWLLGTHQGAIHPAQLDAYLDEFTFRFNRRTSRSRGLLFRRLLEQAVATPPATYQDIKMADG